MGTMTTIQVSKTSKKMWSSMKNHPQESFEDMINRIINTLNEDDSELLTKKDILEIERSVQDIKNGKYITHDTLKKKYGL